MPYQILDVEADVFATNGGAIMQFDTGAEANAQAKQLTAILGRKYRVKRVMDTKWKSREARKLKDGTYEPLPWASEGWWRDLEHIWEQHFPHVSRQTPGMMAYTENVDKGMDNKQTQIKPGKYLAKFFSERLSTGDIRHLAHRFADLYEERKVLFATTEDEIQRVYERGPESCMSSYEYRRANGWGYPTAGKWPNDYHACRIYAAGDLQVAYMHEDPEDQRSSISARSLVWPAKKTHSRVYGDESRLTDALQKLGYKHAPPIGAKVLRKPFESRFIAPYIDAGYRSGAGALSLEDKGDHLVICLHDKNGIYHCNHTGGISSARCGASGEPDAPSYCERCENDEAEDFVRVHFSHAGGDYHSWCQDCVESNAIYDSTDSRYYDGDAMSMQELHDGNWMTTRNFERYGFTCAETGRHHHRRDRVVIGSRYVSRQWAEEHMFQSAWSGEWFPHEQRVAMFDGNSWSREEFSTDGYVCPSCNRNMWSSHRTSTTDLRCIDCAEGLRQPSSTDDVLADLAADVETGPTGTTMHRDEMQAIEDDYRSYMERRQRAERGA